MTHPIETKASFAWQPFTARGVAAFAQASMQRLILVQLFFALVSAATIVWFVKVAWFPVVADAIRALPEQGQITSQKLDWHGASPNLLGEGHFLAFVVDTNHSGTIRSPAHIQIEFGTEDIRVISLGGYYSEFYYADLQRIPFNHVELAAWWGAWKPPILWIVFGGILSWCFVSWTILSAICFLPILLAAFFTNRDLNFAGTWKLTGAALMPGALVMIAGILLYGFGWIDLIQFGAVAIAHIVVSVFYITWGLVAVPKITAVAAVQNNPFAADSQESREIPGNQK